MLAPHAGLRPAAFGRCATVLICAACLSAGANAEVRAPATERGSVMLAGFNTGRNTDARFDSSSGNGTDIDMEDDLGLDRYMTVGRLSGYGWVAQRHRIDLSVFDLSRESSKTLDRDIVIGDEDFSIHTQVDALNQLEIYKLDYTFAPLIRDRGFLGVVGGFYVSRVGVAVSESTGLRQATESRAMTAPLPVFGLRGEYAFGEHVTLRGAVELFALEVSGIKGRLHDAYVGADYSFGKRFALGIAYNDVSINVSAERRAQFEGRLDAAYSGALLYLKIDFGSTR